MSYSVYRISIDSVFEAAHWLPKYQNCKEEVHGHTWKVQVDVETTQVDHEGMAVDFVKLQKIVNEIISKLDHRCLNELEMFVAKPPTAENVAQWIYQVLITSVKNLNARLVQVCVSEGTTGRVSYSQMDDPLEATSQHIAY